MTKLVEVEFETSLGAVYRFPDVDEADVEALIQRFPPRDTANLTLVNVSRACLALPVRIINFIRVGGVERWHR